MSLPGPPPLARVDLSAWLQDALPTHPHLGVGAERRRADQEHPRGVGVDDDDPVGVLEAIGSVTSTTSGGVSV